MPGLLSKLEYNNIHSFQNKLNKIKCHKTDYDSLDWLGR